MLTSEEAELRNRLIEKLKPAFAKVDKRAFVKPAICHKKPLSKKEAETILNYIKVSRKRDKRRREARLYHCPICNAHHLTSKK